MELGHRPSSLSVTPSPHLLFACELAFLRPIVFGDVLKNDDRGLWCCVGDIHHRICNHARQLLLLGGGAPAPHLYSHDRHRSLPLVSRSQGILLECVSQMLTSLLDFLTRL